MSDDVTPIRKQYLDLKRQYPEAILLFRLGDFYETFDADAELVARELDIVLTSRPVGKGQRVPLAGVPHHAVESYVARLIEKGYRVAIAEQMADPATVKGIVPRDVIRVVTPGTVVEPALLDDKRPNYLAAWVTDDERVGLAHVDVTTGEFAVTQFSGDSLDAAQHELIRLAPRECLIPDAAAHGDAVHGDAPPAGMHVTPFAAWKFELANARQSLLDHFQVGTLAGFGCEGQTLAVRAAGAIIQYLREDADARADADHGTDDVQHVGVHDVGRRYAPQPGNHRDDSRAAWRGTGCALGCAGCDAHADGRAALARVAQPAVARPQTDRDAAGACVGVRARYTDP